MGTGACCGKLRNQSARLAGAVTLKQVRTPVRQSEFWLLPSPLILLNGEMLSMLPLLYLIFRCPFSVRKHSGAWHVALLSLPGTWHLKLSFNWSWPATCDLCGILQLCKLSF